MDYNQNNVVNKSNNKFVVVIILLVIIIILLVGIVIYLLFNKDVDKQNDGTKLSKTTSGEVTSDIPSTYKPTTKVTLSREDVIKKNFLNGIAKVRSGEKVDYIMCDASLGVDCTKINDFVITEVTPFNGSTNVYKIKYKVSCSSEEEKCFYNEQFEDFDESTNSDIGASYYQVDKDGNIITILGNNYPSSME